jgi:xanthine dehydrogenase accessory factor
LISLRLRTISKVSRRSNLTWHEYDVMKKATDIIGIISTRKAAGEPFALATVVRTVAATAAKAGAKAVILPDGTITEGWIGGGCARAAVIKAAKDAFADGQARLVSVEPPEELDKHGHKAGEEQGGVRFAENMCPSQGTMDIFVEPVLPRAQIVVCGSSPVAVAIADLAKRMGFAVTACAPAAEQSAFDDVERRIEGYALPVEDVGSRYIVVSTQGRGDEAALLAAFAVDAEYVAFVGSRKKANVLKAKLAERGIPAERLAGLKAPAGLDLGAITPDEIAISILAEIVAVRRGKQSRNPAQPV